MIEQSLDEFILTIAEVMKKGYGKVTLDVFVQDGTVKTVSITRQNTLKVADIIQKE